MTNSGEKKLSVLVAEDSDDVRYVVTTTLESHGHHVVGVRDGKEAEGELRKHKFDVVISDVIMPAADGFDLLRAVRSLQPQARVIMTSGGGFYSTAKANLAQALKLGAWGIIEKPFAPAELLKLLAASTAETSEAS